MHASHAGETVLVDMYRILTLDASRDQGILNALRKVQMSFKRSHGCLGQRILQDLENPDSFIIVSYWPDRESLGNAKELHAAVDRALNGVKVKTATNVYEAIYEV